MLSEFATPDEIRAALGVSDDELEDATITLPVYEFALMRDLRLVDPTVPAQFLSVAQVEYDQRTAEQAQFYESVRLFSVYAVARQLCSSLPMFSPKEVTDSKASMTRFASGTFETTISRIEQEFATNRDYVIQALAAMVPAQTKVVTRRAYMRVANAGYDPVTGS